MTSSPAPISDRMPALFLSHGAPPLVDDTRWVAQLRQLAADLPRPKQILVVSAHWEAAPLTLGATDSRVPLTYDFWGFPDKYYATTYASPGAPELADTIAAMTPDGQEVHRDAERRLDHGAYVPLTVMYPDADIPTLQVSMPTLDPHALFDVGRRLGELRDEGVLIIGSGFTTHGLPYLTDPSPDADAPGWSQEFDAWAHERFAAGDLEGLLRFESDAPGMPYAHPRTEHFAPLFVTLGAATDPEAAPQQPIDGFWMGLAKRSIIAA